MDDHTQIIFPAFLIDPNVGTSQSVETENQDNPTDGPSEDNEGADGVSSEGEKQAVEVEVSNSTYTFKPNPALQTSILLYRRRVEKLRPHRRPRTRASARFAAPSPRVAVAAPLYAAITTTTQTGRHALCGSVILRLAACADILVTMVAKISICQVLHRTAIVYFLTVPAAVAPCGVQDQTTSMPAAVVTRERRKSLLAQADYNPYW